MGRVTSIEPQKKKKDRVNVFIDSVFAFGVSLEIAFLNKLKVGQEISAGQIAELIEKDQVERLQNKALRFLGLRPRSEKEVRDHLTYKGKLSDIQTSEEKQVYTRSIERAIQKLKDLNYLEDSSFARWWVEQRESFRSASRRSIQLELLRKGITKEIIAEVLESGQSEDEKAKNVARKKLKIYKSLPQEKLKVKLGQYLARAGFDWETIKKVVDSLVQKG